MEDYKDSGLPRFHINDDVKARIIAVAVDEKIPFDWALQLVFDYYLQLKKRGSTSTNCIA